MNKIISLGIACLILFIGCEKKSDLKNDKTMMTQGKDDIVIELRSDAFVAFDLPNEGVRYTIPDFEPGLYTIPLKAIRNALEKDQQGSANVIYVDTGTIYFVDADYYDKLRKIENRIWEETKDMYQFIERYDTVVRELGIKYNFALSPGVDSGYDFAGDGVYVLDASLIKKISND